MGLRDVFIEEVRKLTALGITQKTIAAGIGINQPRLSRLLKPAPRAAQGQTPREAKAAAKQKPGDPTATEIEHFRDFLRELRMQILALEAGLDDAWRGRDHPASQAPTERRAG